jgi:hypothetical protein
MSHQTKELLLHGEAPQMIRDVKRMQEDLERMQRQLQQLRRLLLHASIQHCSSHDTVLELLQS